MSTQTVSKWGSSLAFRLPAAFAKQMQLEEGSKVQLAFDGKRLVIEAAEIEPDPKAFFAAVKQSQANHGLVTVGKARGKEIR
jgi:antitoxin component of MazEF toxin-antitoxin module